MKKLLFLIIKIALSVAIIYWLYNKAQEGNQFAEIASYEKNWLLLVTALLLCLTAHIISFIRWRMFSNALEIPLTTWDAIRIGLIGVVFGQVSLGVVGGDSLRIYFAARHVKEKLAEVICSVFTDRAVGMLTMFTIASIGFFFVDMGVESAENPDKLKNIRLLCLAISIVTAVGWVAGLVFLLSPKILSTGPIARLKTLPTVGGIISQFTDVILLYRKRLDVLAAGVFWSVIVNICFVMSVYLIAVGLNVVHPPLTQHFVIGPISTASNAIPLPLGMGGMEFVLSYFYDAVSSANAQTKHGIIVAFVFRTAFLLVSALGAIAWFFNRKEIKEVVQAAETSADSA